MHRHVWRAKGIRFSSKMQHGDTMKLGHVRERGTRGGKTRTGERVALVPLYSSGFSPLQTIHPFSIVSSSGGNNRYGAPPHCSRICKGLCARDMQPTIQPQVQHLRSYCPNWCSFLFHFFFKSPTCLHSLYIHKPEYLKSLSYWR